MLPLPRRPLSIALQTALALLAAGTLQAQNAQVEEITVVGTTPGAGIGMALNKLPFAVRTLSADDLNTAQSLDLSDFLNARTPSVNLNSAQNNPLQPDLQFRGFTASPLLGLPQGIAVYQNGVRINEPLGDAVNWDLLPESAVHSMHLISGADPLFGLNTLGGAIDLNMKNGFNFQGQQLEVIAGDWSRSQISLESGGNNGSFGYYVNLSHFDENGWRDLSDSEAQNLYASLNWRQGDSSALDLNLQKGRSDLTGNGALPLGLLASDRDAIFTAPDITENDMEMVALEGSHFLTPRLQIAGNLFWRRNDTDSFNGDGSEFELCRYSGGGLSLFEEADALEDALEDELDIELDDICAGEVDSIRSFADLQRLIEERAELAGLDEDDFELEDVTDALYGSGVLSDEAVNNISRRRQVTRGLDGKATLLGELAGRDNRLTAGYSWLRAESSFDARLELAFMDPLTRSTEGRGTGTFLRDGETSIDTENETWSVYFVDTLDLRDDLALTFGGRYNNSDIRLRDRSGERPELNGDHSFSRFNPSVGLTWDLDSQTNLFASWSQSNRVPTPIELACNEEVFEVARRFAVERGDDPDDIDFECRLPNAFLADPPLDDVVTNSIELGARGTWNGIGYQAGLFHAVNRDDILFQTTGRYSGLFANVDETRRMGLELGLNGQWAEQLSWYASYSHIRATFEDAFTVLSPNHPLADANGSVAVQKGDRLPGIPEHLLKAGADYRFDFGLSLGLEAIYNSSQHLRGDESNDLARLDGFTVVNLRGSYTLGGIVTLFGRVTNLFDRKYENFGLLGEDPSEVLDGLADERPVFVGPGAPRAGWVGVRVNF